MKIFHSRLKHVRLEIDYSFAFFLKDVFFLLVFSPLVFSFALVFFKKRNKEKKKKKSKFA